MFGHAILHVEHAGLGVEEWESKGEGISVGELDDGSKIIERERSNGGVDYPPDTRTIEIRRLEGKSNEKWTFPTRPH